MPMFDMYNNEPIISPEGLFIPELRAIWDRDKDPSKSQATRELLYVYHMEDPKSAYSRKPIDEKEAIIIQDYFEDTPEWKPDEVVIKAQNKYRELKQSVAVRFLKGLEVMIDKISLYMHEAEINDGAGGNLSQIGSLIQRGDKLMETYAKLIKQVNSELEVFETKYKKGVQPSQILE